MAHMGTKCAMYKYLVQKVWMERMEKFLNFLQMSHIKFCIICRPALPFLYTPNCTKEAELLVTIVHPSAFLKLQLDV